MKWNFTFIFTHLKNFLINSIHYVMSWESMAMNVSTDTLKMTKNRTKKLSSLIFAIQKGEVENSWGITVQLQCLPFGTTHLELKVCHFNVKESVTCNAWFDFGFQKTRITSEKMFLDRQLLKSTQLLGQWFKGRYSNMSGNYCEKCNAS